jgi:hypothetical protein
VRQRDHRIARNPHLAVWPCGGNLRLDYRRAIQFGFPVMQPW